MNEETTKQCKKIVQDLLKNKDAGIYYNYIIK